jgi:biopolymer transport protein TolQ
MVHVPDYICKTLRNSRMENVFIHLFKQSGIVAQLIIIGLFFLSVYAWSIIPAKLLTLKKAITLSDDFFAYFRKAQDPCEISTDRDSSDICPLYALYSDAHAFYLQETTKERMTHEKIIEEVHNRLQRSILTTTVSLDKHVSLLAIAATTSPLLGLLGTVWGIMSTFRDIGLYGASNISIVAPGISESLVTTIAGLLVAIPSLMAYNHIHAKIQYLRTMMELFASEYISLLDMRSP